MTHTSPRMTKAEDSMLSILKTWMNLVTMRYLQADLK